MTDKLFNSEKDLLMFYHTTFRNANVLLTLSFVILTFSRNMNIYDKIAKVFAFFIALCSLYFNYNLIDILSKNENKYPYINQYLYINYTMIVIILILLLFILYKIFSK